MKSKKFIAWLLILIISATTLSGCASLVAPKPPLKVALALARGGLGDKAFNDSAYAGLQRAQTVLGAQVQSIDFQEGDAQTESLRQLAKQNFDLIIALGAENAAPIATVAAENPNQRFAIIDTSVDAPNVTSITFRELEGDFIAGALSAMLSKNNMVGFLGGADVTVVRRIEFGWRQGVLYVNPNAQILSQYAGGKDDFSGFTKPDVGKQLTAQMYQGGADLVYAAAGKTALGAIDAAKDLHKLIITTGSDQRWIAPEVVVTSRTKNMDDAVFSVIKYLADGSLNAGSRVLTFQSGGIGLAPIDGGLVPADVMQKLKTIQDDVLSGKISIQEFKP